MSVPCVLNVSIRLKILKSCKCSITLHGANKQSIVFKETDHLGRRK